MVSSSVSAIGDSFVFPELLDECVRLGRVAAAEDRPCPLVYQSDLVLILTVVSEIGVDQGEDAAAGGDLWLACMACLLPGSTLSALIF